MRAFSGFLLMEDILDYLPNSNTSIVNFSNDVTSPITTIIEANCSTKVGTLIDINYEIEGRVELATDTIINKTRIDTLLAAGTYKVAVRSTGSCVSPNGVCQLCYAATYIDEAVPAVGKKVRIKPEYAYQIDVVKGNGVSTDFTLSESPISYEKVLILINGIVQSSNTYSISGTTLTMNVAPANGTHVVVRFYKTTRQPFMGYLANTYAGSVLGVRPLPTQPLNLRPLLIQAGISDDKISNVKQEIKSQYKLIGSTYIDYADSILDRLERSLYLAVLYGIHGNVAS